MAKSGRSGKAWRVVETAIQELNGVDGKVGYLDSRHYTAKEGEKSLPIAYVAAIQELGHAPSGIPPRPTLLPTIETKAPEYREHFAKGARAILRGEQTAVTVMDQVAKLAATDVQQAIANLTTPPLKPATIRRKGSAKPLIESGQMMNAVDGFAERSK